MPKAALARKPAKTAVSAAFAGFDRAAPQFFHELAAEMNREWFEANKARYQELWVAPMQALLDEVAAKLAKPYAPIKLAPPKIMRIYRDTRFAKDKSPYKTHIGAMIGLAAGGKPVEGACAAMYVHLGVDEEFIGVGTYFFDDKQLPRWRKLVAADKTGATIAGIVKKLRAKGYPTGGHDDYKKVPKPYADDHPRAELLRMRGLTTGFPAIPAGLLHDRGLVDWLVEHAKATVPMVAWLHHNVR